MFVITFNNQPLSLDGASVRNFVRKHNLEVRKSLNKTSVFFCNFRKTYCQKLFLFIPVIDSILLLQNDFMSKAATVI